MRMPCSSNVSTGFVGVLTGLWFLAGCAEQPMEPQPALVAYTFSEEQRQQLQPDVRALLATIEDGTLAGADASPFAATLASFPDIFKGKSFTTYNFTVAVKDGEGAVCIRVRVQNKFNRVVTCVVAEPCW